MAPFRFTVQVHGPPSSVEFAELARRAEGLGYDTLTVSDHFSDQLAPVPAAMAAADATSTLRVGWLVLGNDYRHPVIVAKEAATVDVLSAGRLVLGLGAGWMTSDYESAGIPLDGPGRRIERLAESITVIKGLMADGPFDFVGTHYRITGLDGQPLPSQRPHPPILVGGGGRRVLSLAAREADIVGLNVDLRHGTIDDRAYPNGTAEATDEKLRWIREAAGERFDSLELQTRIHLAAVTEEPEALVESLAPRFGLTTGQAWETPHALLGPPSLIVETLRERRERWGISMIGLSADAMEPMAPVVAELAGT